MSSKTFQRFHIGKSLAICLVLLCATTKGATRIDDKWHPDEDSDPITGKTISRVYVNTLAIHSANPGYFEVIATCDRQGFYLRTTYLPLPNPGFINAGRGKLLIVRMNIDGNVRTARSLPIENSNIAIFVFAPPQGRGDRGDLAGAINDLADTMFAKLPGTAFELVHAKLIRFEIPLADAENPILQIKPQDPEFQRFASKCDSKYPGLITAPPQPSADSSSLPSGTYLPGRRPTTLQPSNPPTTAASTPATPAMGTTNPNIPLTPPTNNTPPNLAVLTIHSAIPGQPNPLARTPFNLMRDDFATTVQKSGIRVQTGTAPPQAFAKICGSRDAACIVRLLRASVAGAAASAVSGPTGDATLPPVPPGEYYLLIYGYDASHRNIFWNEKITLTAGANSFTAGMENSKPLK